MNTHDMVPQKVLILAGEPDLKLAFEEFLSQGPFEIFFAKTGLDGLKNTNSRNHDIATVDMRVQNVQEKTGLNVSSTEGFKARLFVVTPAAPLDLTEEPLEFELVGKLDNAKQHEEIQETSCTSPNSQSPWKTWLESFLEANYSNPDLSFNDAMRKMRFSRSYGCRLFKQHLGMPFLEKLREIRIARAERLITETQMSMKEVAAECGFRSSKRLYEAFRRIHGVSPVEYRKRNIRKA